jgi:hypothetical protein
MDVCCRLTLYGSLLTLHGSFLTLYGSLLLWIGAHGCLLQIRELHVAKERAVRAEVCVCVCLCLCLWLGPRYVPKTWGCICAMYGVRGGIHGVVCVEINVWGGMCGMCGVLCVECLE